MAYLVFEERSPHAELSLSVNGLPLAPETCLRPGDRIRAGDTILRYCEAAPLALSAAAVREPTAAYGAGRDPGDERRALARSPDLVAAAPCMRRLLARVRKVAARQSNVLVLGESGSGKEVIAQAIRANGLRHERPFVKVNAAALPESVLESELFGHERGAFTGAVSRRPGLFELAHGGTLFLDEVAELSLPVQAKLLRALECGEIRRLGGTETIRVDARLIAATHRDLRRAVSQGRFREDLFFRIAVVELRVPSLRERPEDLFPLIEYLLPRLDEGAPGAKLSPEALEALRRYPFPGNVRELRNVLESALNFCEGGVIRLEDLPAVVTRPAEPPTPEFPRLAEVERRHIQEALDRVRWNKSRAAALLGIDRKTLYAKIEHYGLGPLSSDPVDESDPAEEPRGDTA